MASRKNAKNGKNAKNTAPEVIDFGDVTESVKSTRGRKPGAISRFFETLLADGMPTLAREHAINSANHAAVCTITTDRVDANGNVIETDTAVFTKAWAANLKPKSKREWSPMPRDFAAAAATAKTRDGKVSRKNALANAQSVVRRLTDDALTVDIVEQVKALPETTERKSGLTIRKTAKFECYALVGKKSEK